MSDLTSSFQGFRLEETGNHSSLVLALANQKGGVGKTTTAVNLGACLAERGVRVLLVDADPQGNASTGLGSDRSTVKIGTYEVLIGQPIEEALVRTDVENLTLLPSTIDLAGAEVELVSTFAREAKLKQALEPMRPHFDVIVVDSPPSLGMLTINALTAADQVLVPIQCEYYALEGLGQLLRTIELVREALNPPLRIGGVVLTMFDPRTRLAEQVVADVRRHFADAVFQTIIPRTVRLSEAPGFGKPIIRYDGSGKGAAAYRALAGEAVLRWFPAHARQNEGDSGSVDDRNMAKESRHE